MLAPGIASTLSQYATARESRCCTTTLPKRRRSIAALTNPEVYVDRRERASPASRKDASNAGGDMDRAAVGKRMREVVSCEMGARCETDEQRYTGVNALLHSSHAAALDRRRTGAGVGGESEGQGSEGVIQERQLQEQEMGVERNYSAINSLLFQLGKERGRVWDL
ncbi:hypothetical protein BC830DRAFT_1119094 [Chytriomyces sp. MP71]|nr:hypothetical protein BC830DRAFT_1119094 [Chytriomyces sp. MP71]